MSNSALYYMNFSFSHCLLMTPFTDFFYFAIRMASEYQLRVVYKEEFHDVFAEHHEHPEFGPLLQRMKVVDASGESQMDEDQWEAASKSQYCFPVQSVSN